MYPWGNAFNRDIVARILNGQTAPVGSRPEGASWADAMDMSENMWEFVSSADYKYPYDETDGRENLDISLPHVWRSGGISDNGERSLRSANRF